MSSSQIAPDAAQREAMAKAALEEDLGSARRNNLALQGVKKRVDLEQLEKTKRVHQIGSEEWHEVQKASGVISAWKSLAAEADSDDEDLESDMGYGQSHRAALIESRASAGSYRGRGGRGGSYFSTRKAQESRNRAFTPEPAVDTGFYARSGPSQGRAQQAQAWPVSNDARVTTSIQPQGQPSTPTKGPNPAVENTGSRRSKKNKRRLGLQAVAEGQAPQHGESQAVGLGQQKASTEGKKPQAAHAKQASQGKKQQQQQQVPAQPSAQGKKPQTPAQGYKQVPAKVQKPIQGNKAQSKPWSKPQLGPRQPSTPAVKPRPVPEVYPKLADPKDFLTAASTFFSAHGQQNTPESTTPASTNPVPSGPSVPKRMYVPENPFTLDPSSPTKSVKTADVPGTHVTSSATTQPKANKVTVDLFELANAPPGAAVQPEITSAFAAEPTTPSLTRTGAHQKTEQSKNPSSGYASTPETSLPQIGSGSSLIKDPAHSSGRRGRKSGRHGSGKKTGNSTSYIDMLGLYGDPPPDTPDVLQKRRTMQMFGITDETDLDALNEALPSTPDLLIGNVPATTPTSGSGETESDEEKKSKDGSQPMESILDRDEPPFVWDPSSLQSLSIGTATQWANLLADWPKAGGTSSGQAEKSATKTGNALTGQGEESVAKPGDASNGKAGGFTKKPTTTTAPGSGYGATNTNLGSRSSSAQNKLTSDAEAQKTTNKLSNIEELIAFFRDAQPGRYPPFVSIDKYPHLKLPPALSIPLDKSAHAPGQQTWKRRSAVKPDTRITTTKPAVADPFQRTDDVATRDDFRPTPMSFTPPEPRSLSRASGYFSDEHLSESSGDGTSTAIGSASSWAEFARHPTGMLGSALGRNMLNKIRQQTGTAMNNNDGKDKKENVASGQQREQSSENRNPLGAARGHQSEGLATAIAGGSLGPQHVHGNGTIGGNTFSALTGQGTKQDDPFKAISKGGLGSSRWAH